MLPGLDLGQLARFVVKPVMSELGMNSPAALHLLLGTIAQESLGAFIDQITGPGDVTLGPGFGLYQMERATHDDLFDNWLRYNQVPEVKVLAYRSRSPTDPVEQMAGNFWYATAVARCQYRRIPQNLPSADDVEALAAYWKEHWNTHLGKGTIEQWVLNYGKFVKPLQL